MLLINGSQYLIPSAISFVIVAVFAFAYHELAHALVADWLDDPTPRHHGRMTANPIPHLDRTGFILLLLVGFGWAQTPVNPNMMRGNPRSSMAIVSVAGPLANLLMAFLFGLPVILGLVEVTPPGRVLPSVYSFLAFGVFFNLLLFAFNLLPVPPLDGFRILLGVLPAEMAYRLEPLYRYSMLIFLGIFFLLPIVGINVFGLVLGPVLSFFRPLLLGANAPIFF